MTTIIPAFLVYNLLEDTQEMNKEFEECAKNALLEFKSATKLPRKLKKKVHKEAIKKYNLYKGLIDWNNDFLINGVYKD